MSMDVLTALRQALPAPGAVACDPADLTRHQSDFTPPRPPVASLAVLYPRSTDEVAAVMRIASASRTPVVTQGGLTGMTGGAVPSEGAILLSMERMRAILEVDLDAATMTVEAGAPLETIQQRAAEAGRLFPLDLGARGSCTIGGNLATNAGGNRVLRYGMARDLVLGLEAVLADGTVLTSLNKMMKNNAGYDLKQLFIGSEGTLGIVTRAVLRLFPRPRSANTALCAVPDLAAAVALLHHVQERAGPTLSAFEAMWPEFYAVASRVRGTPPLRPTDGEMVVLLDVEGNDPDRDDDAFVAMIGEALDTGIVRDAVVAQSQSDAATFWAIRDTSGELGRMWHPVLNFDVSLPIGSMSDWVDRCRSTLDRSVVDPQPLFFGHLADSNLHVAVRWDGSSEAKQAIDGAVYTTVAAVGGSISAEHGIGMDKRHYLHLTRSPAEIALMRQIKMTLDPLDLLNPGKVVPT